MIVEVLWTPNGGRLVVELPDHSALIRCRTATDTFVEAIKRIDIEQVKTLNITVSGIPLISTTKYPQPHTQRKVGNYYIATNLHPEALATKLEQIATGLNITLYAELFPNQ